MKTKRNLYLSVILVFVAFVATSFITPAQKTDTSLQNNLFTTASAQTRQIVGGGGGQHTHKRLLGWFFQKPLRG